jgi:iron only hydrogenase large subunit-like protein
MLGRSRALAKSKMKKDANHLKFPLKGKYVAMLAPSYIVEFDYPSIIHKLKKLGFDKVVELTFGAKLVNREYHKKLEKSKGLVISSPCPGIVENIKARFPQYAVNLAKIDSPMVATAKICKKIYPLHKTVFISPCNYKKMEVENSSVVDYVIDYRELEGLFRRYNIKESKKKAHFDKFYNEYTKIYPVSGGLAKTAHLKGAIKKNQIKVLDGIGNVFAFLKNPDPKIRFLDVLFCNGGCVGGPCITSNLDIKKRKKKVLDYLKLAKHEGIPKYRRGIIEKSENLVFSH